MKTLTKILDYIGLGVCFSLGDDPRQIPNTYTFYNDDEYWVNHFNTE